MTIDPVCPVQSLHVAVSDGVRLAVDVWLPVERIARGEPVGTAFRATRCHWAEQPPGPEPEADSNHAAGQLWTRAGFALVVADARGTGASFGSRTMELSPREIADYGELIDWVAAQAVVQRPGRCLRHVLRRPGRRARRRPRQPARGRRGPPEQQAELDELARRLEEYERPRPRRVPAIR